MDIRIWFCFTAVLIQFGSVTSYYHLHRDRTSGNRTCRQTLSRIGHLSIEAPQPPNIAGEWTSQRCEVRPGPEFILRRYYFQRHHFKLQQYYYKDPGCKRPAYGVVAEGHYRHKRPSWIVQGGTETAYTVHNVSVIPYTSNVARTFTKNAQFCTELANMNFSTFRKTKILNFPPYAKNSHDASRDFDCSFVFNLTFHELQLIRLEIQNHHVYSSIKYFRVVKAKRARTEKLLFLGDIHTDVKQRASYRPTAYQTALRPVFTRKCHVCSLIANSHDFLPPQLKNGRNTALDLTGEWVSRRCETRQYGQFLTRHLSFYPDGSSWSGQYDFYRDPLCLNPSFTLKVKGMYSIKADSKSIVGAKNCNFRIHNLKVKPMSQLITQNLNIFGGQGCGRPKSWETFEEQDVTSTGGCSTLGINLPSVEHELLKIEKSHNKKLLFIGQRPTDQGVRPVGELPTSFQEPLLQCTNAQDPPKKTKFITKYKLPYFQKLESLESSSANNIHFVAYRLFSLVVSFFIVRIL
uniref:APCDD1 domain-containing protein n=1 Tax=Magallana gigas TaxID=29159 RepID=A0A8W8KFG0_MAGGI|nr:protein APCDD1 [Crassostrea gigas]|eukprot:XP_011432770.1 PREDICTED: protein APCDD1 [Crassostrea gigas]